MHSTESIVCSKNILWLYWVSLLFKVINYLRSQFINLYQLKYPGNQEELIFLFFFSRRSFTGRTQLLDLPSMWLTGKSLNFNGVYPVLRKWIKVEGERKISMSIGIVSKVTHPKSQQRFWSLETAHCARATQLSTLTFFFTISIYSSLPKIIMVVLHPENKIMKSTWGYMREFC